MEWITSGSFFLSFKKGKGEKGVSRPIVEGVGMLEVEVKLEMVEVEIKEEMVEVE